MSAVIAASVAGFLVLVASVLAVRRANVRSHRRIEAVLRQLDEDLRAFSEDLRAIAARSRGARARGVGELGLILNLDELLTQLTALAARETGGQATAVRVQGPGEGLATASFGAEDVGTLLEAVVRPPGRRPFRALTVNWAFPPSVEGESETFRSALVVPIVQDGVETGTLAAFAETAAAFRPEHARALEALAEEAAPAIASARRFAGMELHDFGRPTQAGTASDAAPAPRDPLTGLDTRETFQERLAREVTRARGLAYSLALLIVDVDDFRSVNVRLGHAAADEVLTDLATRVGDSVRNGGVTSRVGADEFAVLLPRSTAADAESVYAAVRASLLTRPPQHLDRLALSAGITELATGDDPDSVFERAAHALLQAKQLGAGTVVVATPGSDRRR